MKLSSNTFGSVALLLLAATACGDDTSDKVTSDGGVSIPDVAGHPDAQPTSNPDAGVQSDAMANPDAEPINWDYGTKIAEVPGDLIGITPDESEVIYVKRVQNRDRIFAYETATGMTREIDGNSTFSIYTDSKEGGLGFRSTRPVMWFFSNLLRSVGESGFVRTYRVATKEVTVVAEDAAKDVLAISENGEWAVTTEGYDVERGSQTSTRTADIIIVSADGNTKHTIVSEANMGDWNNSDDVFEGRCAMRAAWTSSVTVAIVACPNSTKRSTMYFVNALTGTSTIVTESASRYLNVNPEQTFFFWGNLEGDLFATSADTSTTVPFVTTSTVEEIHFLDNRRFAFNTSEDELRIGSWPTLNSTVIQSFGVENIRRIAPTGDYLLFSQNDDFISDLYQITTATDTQNEPTPVETNGYAYPGDDAYSTDGERLYWYQETNPNLIGDITTRRTDGTGSDTILTRQAYWIFNYANPLRVVLLVNAVEIRQNRIISDLATRARDGSDELDVFAGGVLSAPRDFIVFPMTNRIVYHVPEGHAPGIYLRELP